MISRIKFVLRASLLLTLTVFIFVTHKANAEPQTAHFETQPEHRAMGTSLSLAIASGPQQLKERRIDKWPDVSPPVKITLVKTKKKSSIRLGEKFVDDDDWLKGLTIRVDNSSGKSFRYARIEIKFPPPEDAGHDIPAVYDLEHGDAPFRYQTEEEMPPLRVRPVLPGESLEISLSDRGFDDLEFFLKSAGYLRGTRGTNAIALRITDIGFSDGTVWNLGRILRRDPKSFWGWSPVPQRWEQPHVKDGFLVTAP